MARNKELNQRVFVTGAFIRIIIPVIIFGEWKLLKMIESIVSEDSAPGIGMALIGLFFLLLYLSILLSKLLERLVFGSSRRSFIDNEYYK